jgi:hypothetical protein
MLDQVSLGQCSLGQVRVFQDSESKIVLAKESIHGIAVPKS